MWEISLAILILYLFFLLFGAFIFRLQFGIVSALRLILKICVFVIRGMGYGVCIISKVIVPYQELFK
jgi:hypothetical protein